MVSYLKRVDHLKVKSSEYVTIMRHILSLSLIIDEYLALT